MGVPPQPPPDRSRLRSGKRGHRRARAACRSRRRGRRGCSRRRASTASTSSSWDPKRHWSAGWPTPARGGHRRVRADRSGGAPRRVQGVLQGVHGGHGRRDRALRSPVARPPARRQGGRPGRRKGRGCRARRGDAGARAAHALRRGVPSSRRCSGRGVSFFVLCRRHHVARARPCQDYKRVGDGDLGPEHRRHGNVLAVRGFDDDPDGARAEVDAPTLRGLAAEGAPFAACCSSA